MKGIKKCLSCLLVCIGLFTTFLSFQVSAAEYGAVYPDYLKQSSACFVECDTLLGKGTLVLPINYKTDTIGFYGDGYELFNCTSSTVTGQFVLENGDTYSCRATAFGVFQYRISDDYYNQYTDLGCFSIFNTNVEFLDETDTRNNSIFDFTVTEQIFIVLDILLLFVLILILFRKVI